MTIDVTEKKKDFPLLQRHINGKPLICLYSANTSQKPVSVMDAMGCNQAPMRPMRTRCPV